MALLAMATWEKAWSCDGRLHAELLAGDGVVLFGQETDIVAQAQEPFVEGGGLIAATHQGEAVDEPERTQQKRSLFATDTVVSVVYLIARH